MAYPTFQSSQTNSAAASSVVVTKPVSLAVGDIMLAWVTAYRNAGSVSITTPAGWTLINSDASSQAGAASFYKIADANDVAAANFTFSSNATATDEMTASVTRITTDNTVTPVDGSVHSISSFSVAGFTPTFWNGLFIVLTGHVSSVTRTVSTYAMATSNPAWTEAFDFDTQSGDTVAFAGQSLAYANRGAQTATGTISATPSGAISTGFLQCISFVPALPTPLVLTGSINRPVTPISALPLHLTGTLPAPTQSDIAPDWANTAKHSSTWANPAKS